MSTAEQFATALNELRSHLGDRVFGPDDPGWDEARRPWNLSVDQHPAVVATPESSRDVVAVVDIAREHGLRVAPQATGHSASPRAPCAAANCASSRKASSKAESAASMFPLISRRSSKARPR